MRKDIKREITKNGMETDRKIYITHSNSNNSYKRQKCHGGRDNVMHEGDKNVMVDTPQMSPIVSKELISKDINIVSEEIDGVTKAPLFLSFGKYVFLFPGEYESLCKELGKERLDSIIEQINEWHAETGSKPKKRYVITIRKWHRKDFYHEKLSKNTSIPRSFFEKFKERFKNTPNILIHEQCIEFIRGASPSLIAKFDMEGKQISEERLRIMGLSMD